MADDVHADRAHPGHALPAGQPDAVALLRDRREERAAGQPRRGAEGRSAERLPRAGRRRRQHRRRHHHGVEALFAQSGDPGPRDAHPGDRRLQQQEDRRERDHHRADRRRPASGGGRGRAGGRDVAGLRSVQGQHPGPLRLRRSHAGRAQQHRRGPVARDPAQGRRLHRAAPPVHLQRSTARQHLRHQGGDALPRPDVHRLRAHGWSRRGWRHQRRCLGMLAGAGSRARAGRDADRGVGALHLLEQRGDGAQRQHGVREPALPASRESRARRAPASIPSPGGSA